MPGRTLVGSTVLGNALKCVSASSQYCTRTTASTQANNITVAFWVYMDSLPGTIATLFQNGDRNPHNGYNLYIDSTGLVKFDMTFVTNINAGPVFSVGTWYHVVAVRDAGTTKFYINGTASGTTTASAWNAIGAGDKMTIGAGYSAGYLDYANARFDDVRYYNRAISAAEALSLYNYGLNINSGDISNTSLVMWWKLDETSGTSAADSSGNSKTGTTSGTPTFVTGKVAVTSIPAVQFDSYLYDGVNQYADIPDNAAYSIPTTGALTVSVWLKQYTNQFTLYEGSGYVNVLGKSDFGSPNHVEWQMRLYNLTNTETDMRGNESSFYVFNSTGGTGVSSDFMRETTDVNRWVHYLATMDGTYVRLYKDGVLQEVANYATFPITPADTIAKIYVAHADNNGYYYGEVGPIKIWNRVLKQGEITRQYTVNESNTSGLVGHWLADGANSRLTDQTATANHGTLRNSPTFVSGTINSSRRLAIRRKPVYTKQQVNLNGTTQYATIADASQTGLDVDDKDFLITGWVKFNALSSVQTVFAKVDTGHANAGSAGAIGYDCIFNTTAPGTITFRTRSAASGNQTASYKFPTDGKEHHIALVFRRGSSGRCQLWLDGVRVVNFSSFLADMGNDGVFRFGASSGSAISQFLKGSLFAWHFYTWTAQTMPADYQNIIDDVFKYKSTTYTNGLVSIWKFDGDLNDSYGANHLTGTASPTYSALTGRTLAS